MADHSVPLYSLICVPVLSFVVCAAIYLSLHPSSGLNGFTGATLLLYGTLAAFSVFLMGSALRRESFLPCAPCAPCALHRSDDLHLATARLHFFVSDFKLRWSQVSGKEWRKYLMAWCFMMLIFFGAQVIEAFDTRDLPSHVRAWRYAIQAEPVCFFNSL